MSAAGWGQLALFFLALFALTRPIGAWLYETFGVTLAFRWTGAALACAVMGFPLMVRAMRLSIESDGVLVYPAD